MKTIYKEGDMIRDFKFVSYEKTHNTQGQMVKVICPFCEEPFITALGDVKRKKKSCSECSRLTKTKHLIKHGESRSRLGLRFKSMRARCYNPNNPQYKVYGGRGIKICDEWFNDRTKFFEWAKQNGWDEALEIDRIDNDRNYSPDNCRWVTREENQMNMGNKMTKIFIKHGYRGLKRDRDKWNAAFTYKGKSHYAGSASTPKEAAVLHDAYVILHKLDRKLNF